MTGRERYWKRRKAWRIAHRCVYDGEWVRVRDENGDMSYIALWRFYSKVRP